MSKYVYCKAEHFANPEIYSLYLRVCENVSRCVLAYGEGVFGGHVGQVGDGVAGERGYVEGGHTQAVRYVVSGCRDLGGNGSGVGEQSGDGTSVEHVAIERDAQTRGFSSEATAGCVKSESCAGDASFGEFVASVEGKCSEARVNGVVRGRNWKSNQRKAAKRREKAKVSGDVPEWRRKSGVKQIVEESKTELQVSLEAKWKVENELKVLEAQRKIELLKKQDVDAIAKCNARKLQAASEKAMVQMEKAHATLVATGNVPGEVALGGTAHTVVDGEIVPSLTNSCSISPSSSISEREVREMMKALEDEKKKNAELEEKMKFMKLDHKLERFGDQCAVTMTCDSEGELPEGREELLEQIVRANNGREEDRVYKKDHFKKKIVNVKVQQYRQLGMDEYVGAFDY